MMPSSRTLACVLLLSACSPRAALPAPPDDRPVVMKMEPGDLVERGDDPLRLRFDRPMVSVEAVGPALPPAPVTVEPEQPLRVHWEDRQTLVIRPDAEWKALTRYALRLGPELARQLKPPHRWTFDAQPLRLTQLSAGGERNVSRQPQLTLWFSADVDPRQVIARCVLVAQDAKKTSVALRLAPVQYGEESAVTVDPVARLPELTRYAVDCPGLLAVRGTSPFRFDGDDDGFRFTTHGPLKVLGVQPAAGSAPAPERAGLCLQLSTPVPMEELAAHVHVSPAPEGLAESWNQSACTSSWVDTDRASSVVLPPRRDYRVTVDGDLKDAFGQKLGKPYVWSFETGDRLPGLWTNQGTAVVFEQGQSGHGVGALNLQSVAFSCARLEPAQLASKFDAMSGWVNQWRDAPDEQRIAPPWQQLGIAVTPQSLDVSAAPNAGRTAAIDLGAACGGGKGAPGLYASLLEPAGARANRELQGDASARMIANVTDLALVAKRGAHTGLVWVTRFSNGALVAGATVHALDGSGAVLAQTRTDAQGLARFTRLPPSDGDTFFSARLGQDVAIVGTEWSWREGLLPYQLGVREEYEQESTRVFVHLDRGVYRPGERVLVHGLARSFSDLQKARVPAGAIAHVVAHLGQDEITRDVPLSDFGSFATELDVPKHVPPGVYSLEVAVDGKTAGYELRVAEFRPLTFELDGGPARTQVLAPEPITLQIAARYLFGAPLPDAQLRWTVERSPATISPPGFDEFSFVDGAPALPDEEPLPAPPQGIVLEREAKTDAKGAAALSFPTEAARGPTRYAITVEAQDSGHDVASRAYSVLAHSAERYPGVRMTSWLFSPDEPVRAEVVVVDREGHAVAGDIELELRESEWQCSDPRAGCRAQVRVVEQQRVSVAAGKPALVTFTKPARGDVHVRALTRDAAGRTARASASAWVWSPRGEGPYNDRVAATLSVDKRRYAPGEHARLALQTPLAPSHYLITAERGDVLSAKVVASAGSAGGAAPELALDARSAPNVFLTMAATTPRSGAGEAGKPRLVAGAREVAVEGRTRALEAEIALERTRYEPGQRVAGEVTVTHLGKPVRAEVALVAVNESVLQLTGFATPDPTKEFHAPRALGVKTVSNVTRVVGDLAAATRIPEVARIQDGGEDGGGRVRDLRNDYVAAAYWAPSLRTDARGKVAFAFDAPTDLSAYRLMAVVAARDDRVGSADARIEVQQPLSVHPVAPRFASAGDALELAAVVHDHTGAPGAIDVRWSAKGLTLAQPTSSLPGADPGGRTVYTRAVVQPGDSASFDVQVGKGAAKDRVGRTLQVRRPLDRELRVLAQLRAADVKTRLEWPAGIDPALSRLEITADRLGLAPLAPVLAAVLDYPYGCTEQTSAALSAIVAAPELAAALVPAWRDHAKLTAHVEDGMSRLVQARTPDGSFGLYPGLPARPRLTAYVLETGLALRAAGFTVPAALTDGAIAALRAWLMGQRLDAAARDELEVAAQATWLLAAAGDPAKGSEERVWAQRARLTLSGRAFLLHALALRNLAPERRAALRASLRDARLHKTQRDFEQPFDSDEYRTAVALGALHADRGDPALERELATWLIARAADPAVYLSTRDIAAILVALGAYARGDSAGAQHVDIGLGARVLFTGELSGMQVVSLELAARDAPADDVWLRANGPVTVSIRRRDVSPSRDQLEFSRGLTLVRRYLQPKTERALGELAIGQLVQVTLELRTDRAMRMVALTDPLPAGLDPVDPGLSSGRVGGCDHCDDLGGFDYLRRHDDRIEAFAERLPAGTHTLRYLLRATTAGSFTAPGATAQPMYLPNLYARSQAGKLSVKR